MFGRLVFGAAVVASVLTLPAVAASASTGDHPQGDPGSSWCQDNNGNDHSNYGDHNNYGDNGNQVWGQQGNQQQGGQGDNQQGQNGDHQGQYNQGPDQRQGDNGCGQNCDLRDPRFQSFAPFSLRDFPPTDQPWFSWDRDHSNCGDPDTEGCQFGDFNGRNFLSFTDQTRGDNRGDCTTDCRGDGRDFSFTSQNDRHDGCDFCDWNGDRNDHNSWGDQRNRDHGDSQGCECRGRDNGYGNDGRNCGDHDRGGKCQVTVILAGDVRGVLTTQSSLLVGEKLTLNGFPYVVTFVSTHNGLTTFKVTPSLPSFGVPRLLYFHTVCTPDRDHHHHGHGDYEGSGRFYQFAF